MSEYASTRLAVASNDARFRELVQDALRHARRLGASDAAAEISESCGLSVSVRNQDVDTIEQNRDRSLSVTVFAGGRRGSAATSDLSPKAVRETVEAAWHIASHTAEDPAAALPDADMLAVEFPDLELHQPWHISAAEATQLAARVEQAARDESPLITNTEGASVDTYEGQFVLGNTRGFLAGYPYSRHSVSVSPIAGRGDGMQRDYWFTSARAPDALEAPEIVGRIAARRALARLSAQRMRTGRFPVVFEAPLAAGLLGALVQAVSGSALYRKASFLPDALGKTVMSEHIDIIEDPFLRRGMASSAFDGEGVRTARRALIDKGVLQGYFLSTYTGRKLNMRSTGNAGGPHNLELRSRLTRAEDDLSALLGTMGRGLLVTELIGQGVNPVTGDYSRGAFGYWVENGEIVHPVEEITIAGNLAEMFRQIVAVGSDRLTRGARTTGSILIESMAVAGQ
ncbi:MAG: metalloprotease PmbA [Castellaniella sp.]